MCFNCFGSFSKIRWCITDREPVLKIKNGALKSEVCPKTKNRRFRKLAKPRMHYAVIRSRVLTSDAPGYNGIPNEFRLTKRYVFARVGLLARWCNGSTKDSGSFCRGSNPCRAARRRFEQLLCFLTRCGFSGELACVGQVFTF